MGITPNRGAKTTRSFTVELPTDLHTKLLKKAREEDRSGGQVIRELLRNALAASAAPQNEDR